MNLVSISDYTKRIMFLLVAGICITFLSACGEKDQASVVSTSAKNNQIESVTAIREVLLGNNSFLLDGDEVYINQITALNGEYFDNPLEVLNVASVDFDQDGLMEAVVEVTDQMDGWMIVLHYDGGSVSGYGFGFRSMQSIYEDGTVLSSSGADESSLFRLTFKKDEVKTKTVKNTSESALIQWCAYSADTVTAIWSEAAAGDIMKSEIGSKLLNYEQACELLDIGDYESALSIFESLGEFKDASRHADGIRCIEYAEKVGNKLSTFGNLSAEWLMGATVRCSYSPETYTFCEQLSFSKSGLYGWAFSLGSALGELDYDTLDSAGIKSTAENLYYDYFYQFGYPGVICVVEWYDEANDAFMSGRYSGLDDVPAADGARETTLQDVQEYAMNRYFVVEDGVLVEYCGNTQVVEIPEGVVTIGQDVFAWDDTVEEIHLPSTLRNIDDGAFFYCENLKNVYLNDGLENIGFRAFYYNKQLESMTIPSSVVEIANDGIWGQNLTDIYYEGTAEEWNNIATEYSVGSFQDITIHASDLAFNPRDNSNYDNPMEDDYYDGFYSEEEFASSTW